MSTQDISPSYDIARMGFLADEIVFAILAAREQAEIDDGDRETLKHASALLHALATLDDDTTVARSTGQLRGLVATRRHALQAARGTRNSPADFQAVLTAMAAQLDTLLAGAQSRGSQEDLTGVLDFFELLGQVSLAEVRRVSEGSRPAWMSSLPTGLY